MECDADPLSLHPVKTYCVPAVPACVVATAIVCEPIVRISAWGAVSGGPPSTVNCKPAGLIWMVVKIADATVVTSVTLALGDPPPDTVAWLVTEGGAFGATLTVTTIVG